MAAGSSIGHIAPFVSEEQKIGTYLERIQLFFVANAVEDDKKVAVLLTVIGSNTYSLLADLAAPDAPSTKTFAELSELLTNHFQPKKMVVAERFRFQRRFQLENESVMEFTAGLRTLSRDCNFGDFLNDALRDQFVCGLRSEALQSKLLAEDGLTLQRAIEIAKAQEAARRDAHRFQDTTDNPPTIGFIRRKEDPPSNSPTRLCYRCGKGNHSSSMCRFKDAKCHECGKKGHIASVCRSRKKGPRPSPAGNLRELEGTVCER